MWEFDYSEDYQDTSFSSSDSPTGYYIRCKSTWTCIANDEGYFRFKEEKLGERISFSGRHSVPPPYYTYREIRNPFASKRDIGIPKVSPHFEGIFTDFTLIKNYKYNTPAVDIFEIRGGGQGSSFSNSLKLNNINGLMQIGISYGTRYSSSGSKYTRILP